ncbi:hypothetical protein SD457_05435 [Coprobacillaceae bacterium CR2/5/TPMF4]|nr:hypothetical protein SD457_05435 [Coprobacillaceae bacterium CR2/5/TPMF4]
MNKSASYTESLTMSFEDYAKQSGYESSQEYIDDVITDGVKQNLLLKNILMKITMIYLMNIK